MTYDTEVTGVSSVTLEFSDGTALDSQKTVTLNLVKSDTNSAGAGQGVASATLPPATPANIAAPPTGSGETTDKPANPTEKALSDADRKTLQKALGIPQTGKFDDATHAAIVKGS